MEKGEIVDVGKHNDTVMALAHAIDQFKPRNTDYAPMATKTTSMGGWGKKRKSVKKKRKTCETPRKVPEIRRIILKSH